MHLLDYREAVWQEVDHAPGGSPEAIARTNADLQKALYTLFADAPFLFRKYERVLHLDEDLVPDGDTDTLEIGQTGGGGLLDAWVVQTTYPMADDMGAKWGLVARQLDGRTLRITDPNDPGYYHYFRIREMWTEALDPDEPEYVVARMSLVEPIPSSWVDEQLEWRVLTSEYALPNDIIRLSGISVDIDGRTYPVRVESEGIAEDLALLDHAHDQSVGGSRPFTAYRRQAEGLARPIVPANVEVVTGLGTWDSTTSPFGTHEYFWTISMGFRHREVAYSDPKHPSDEVFDFSRLTPYWESAPSPVSAAAVVSGAGQVVRLRFPDLQLLLGFGDAGTLRNTHTGVWVNIYRRRTVADALGLTYASEHAHFLGRFKANGATTYVDDGSVLPAQSVPLRENTKYQTLRFHPYPDARYRVRLRGYIRPIPPKDDFEDVPVPDDAQLAVISLAAKQFYKRAGNGAFMGLMDVAYVQARASLAKQYGQAKPRKHPARRGLARVGSTRGGTHRAVPSGLVRDA